MPVLSVVMPFFNVSAYLTRVLESLERQTFTDFEAILVDDGSQDDSAAIAAELARRDPRFIVVQQDNTGPGPARNRGIALARGEYLTFVDGDDHVPPDAYRSMLGSLQRTGSDIVIGQVVRFTGTGDPFESPLHAGIGEPAAQRTHITQYPALVANRTMYNQMYRRSFWDTHGFRFDAAIYEDIAVAAEAQARAGAVDVLSEVVYWWRMRGPSEPTSITGAFGQPANVVALMDAVAQTNDLFQKLAPAAKPAHDRIIIRYDFDAILTAMPAASRAQRELILERAEQCVSSFSGLDPGDLAPEDRRLYLGVVDLLTAA